MSEVQSTPLVDLRTVVIGNPTVERIARAVSKARGFDPDQIINKDRKIIGWMVNALKRMDGA